MSRHFLVFFRQNTQICLLTIAGIENLFDGVFKVDRFCKEHYSGHQDDRHQMMRLSFVVAVQLAAFAAAMSVSVDSVCPLDCGTTAPCCAGSKCVRHGRMNTWLSVWPSELHRVVRLLSHWCSMVDDRHVCYRVLVVVAELLGVISAGLTWL
ncbi:hypothetical protein EDB19DRAFT_1762825 [Suillus lakei]|nr:hypothetical protein EDB19DRAFT_1762825 [Suillus lakei]